MKALMLRPLLRILRTAICTANYSYIHTTVRNEHQAPVKVIKGKLCDLFYEVQVGKLKQTLSTLAAIAASTGATAVLQHSKSYTTGKKS